MTRSTRRNPVETPIENIPSELLDEPIRRPRKPKASIPNLEYIPDPDLPPCETDEVVELEEENAIIKKLVNIININK